MNKKTEYSVKELNVYIKHIIKTSQQNAAEGKKRVSAEIIGPAGLGKTSLIGQVAEELDMIIAKKNLATIEDLSDLVGYPVREFLMKAPDMIVGKNADGVVGPVENPNKGETIWVAEQLLDDYRKKGYSVTGQDRSGYCDPEWLTDRSKPGILLLD